MIYTHAQCCGFDSRAGHLPYGYNWPPPHFFKQGALQILNARMGLSQDGTAKNMVRVTGHRNMTEKKTVKTASHAS